MGCWPTGLRDAVWIAQGGLCSFCREFVQLELCQGHHIVPKSKGGPNTRENMEVRCRFCERWLHKKYSKYGGNCPEGEYAEAVQRALAQKHGHDLDEDEEVVECDQYDTPKPRIATRPPKSIPSYIGAKALRRQTRILCIDMMAIANSTLMNWYDKAAVLAVMDKAFKKQEAVRQPNHAPIQIQGISVG